MLEEEENENKANKKIDLSSAVNNKKMQLQLR